MRSNPALFAAALFGCLLGYLGWQYQRLDRDARRAGVSQPKLRRGEAAPSIALAAVGITLGAWFIGLGLLPNALVAFAGSVGILWRRKFGRASLAIVRHLDGRRRLVQAHRPGRREAELAPEERLAQRWPLGLLGAEPNMTVRELGEY
jgi:hypothetical protein